MTTRPRFTTETTLARSLDVRANTELLGPVVIEDSAELPGQLTVGGEVRIQGPLVVAGDAEAQGPLAVAGNANLQGLLTVSGSAAFEGMEVDTLVVRGSLESSDIDECVVQLEQLERYTHLTVEGFHRLWPLRWFYEGSYDDA